MPHRPAKRTYLANRKRPAWNREPDYWLREKIRLDLIETIRSTADRFSELDHVCPGCDTRIWEAQKAELIYRGCHCCSLTLPPQHRLYVFDPTAWAEIISVGSLYRLAEEHGAIPE
jgi:hypothetical protein